ncbi:MAG: DUF4424 family protein [Myxococcales bacterium]|nr:DUF4424 family protein [Myxococcales bacterium]
MSKPSRRACLLALLLVRAFFLANTARADGTYVKFGPGGVIPMRNEHIQMVREQVDLTVHRQSLLADDSKVLVEVTYVFRNHSDRRQRVHMGFPVGLDFREQFLQDEGYLQRRRPNPISRFVARVDGRRVATRLVPSKKRARFPVGKFRDSTNLIERGRKAIASSPPLFDRYHVWAVTFAPKQQRKVVNRYIYNTRAGIYRNRNELRYVLRTGAAWRGKIEEAIIRLHLGDKGCISGQPLHGVCFQIRDLSDKPLAWRADPFRRKPDAPSGVKPAPPRRQVASDGRITYVWSLKHFEPKQDLHLYYETAWRARRQLWNAIGKATRRARDRELLRAARDVLLALHGVVFKDAALQRRMAAKSWYVPRPKMPRARARRDKLLLRVESALRRAKR